MKRSVVQSIVCEVVGILLGEESCCVLLVCLRETLAQEVFPGDDWLLLKAFLLIRSWDVVFSSKPVIGAVRECGASRVLGGLRS